MATQYAFGQIVTSGLVLALDAADRNSYVSGSMTWNDVSGNGNNGTLTNGPTFSNNSIVFDGVDDYFITNTTFAIPTNNRTFEVWMKINSALFPQSSFFTILVQTSNFNNTNSNIVTGLQKISGTTNIIQPVGNGTTYNAYSNGFDYSNLIGTWMHILGTIEGGSSSKIYLNGNLVSNVPITINPEQTSRHISIGYFQGPNFNMANAKIYNRALSASEVLQNYNAQKSRFNL